VVSILDNPLIIELQIGGGGGLDRNLVVKHVYKTENAQERSEKVKAIIIEAFKRNLNKKG
jgi:hypothetical protein